MMERHCSEHEFFHCTLLKISVCYDLTQCSLAEMCQGFEESYLVSYCDTATPKVPIIYCVFSATEGTLAGPSGPAV
jgi:hypothetical protein